MNMFKLIGRGKRWFSEIGRFERYSIRVLTTEHRQNALELLSQQFNKKEPLSLAYYKQFPQKQKHSLSDWRDFWLQFGQQFFISNLSVGCFDLQTNQIVGTLLGKCIKAVPKHYYENLSQQNFKYPINQFGRQLFANIYQPYEEIASSNTIKVSHLWGGSLKDEHMGKKLLHRMIYCNEYLAFKRGYQYTFSWASNLKSGVAFAKLGYIKIAELNASQFEFKSIRVFQKIADEQKYQSLWLKKIGSFQKNPPFYL